MYSHSGKEPVKHVRQFVGEVHHFLNLPRKISFTNILDIAACWKVCLY